MARAAKYIVIDDANQYDRHYDFTVPPNCYRGEPSILTWMLTIDMASSKLSMDVSVNSILSYTATFTSNRYGPLQEVINPNVLLWGKNRLDFTFYNDDEAYSAILSDIVLWIEVDI